MDLAQAKEIWKELQSIVGDGKVSLQIKIDFKFLHYSVLSIV